MIKKLAGVAAASVFAMGLAATAQAGGIIDNGTVKLGVNDEGHLNIEGGDPSIVEGTTAVGLRHITAGGEYESTSHGCLCEGWGAGVAGTAISGEASVDSGGVDVTFVSFVSDGTTATSVTEIDGSLRVTHDYHPDPDTPFLYEVTVTIENISGGTLGDTSAGSTDIRYRRAMDWDVEPTTFSEYVTIDGWPADNLLATSDNGFVGPDPLFDGPLADIGGCPVDADFIDCGATDHGAAFDFGFEGLEDGESVEFQIYYGAAPTEAEAIAALADAEVEVYSFGQCDPDFFTDFGCSITTGVPVTHIFGFAGVGGRPVVDTPAPATLGLLALGLLGVGAAARKRRAA